MTNIKSQDYVTVEKFQNTIVLSTVTIEPFSKEAIFLTLY